MVWDLSKREDKTGGSVRERMLEVGLEEEFFLFDIYISFMMLTCGLLKYVDATVRGYPIPIHLHFGVSLSPASFFSLSISFRSCSIFSTELQNKREKREKIKERKEKREERKERRENCS